MVISASTAKKCMVGAVLGRKREPGQAPCLLDVIAVEGSGLSKRVITRDENSGVKWSFAVDQVRGLRLVREAEPFAIPDVVA